MLLQPLSDRLNLRGAGGGVQRSKADCQRLQTLVESLGPAGPKVAIKTHRMVLGAALEAATAEARYFDLALLPWDAGTVSAQDMAQALVKKL